MWGHLSSKGLEEVLEEPTLSSSSPDESKRGIASVPRKDRRVAAAQKQPDESKRGGNRKVESKRLPLPAALLSYRHSLE